MIKPLDIGAINNQPKTLNLMFCSAPTVYENTLNYKPLGQKLNLNCCGTKGSCKLGNKLDKIV